MNEILLRSFSLEIFLSFSIVFLLIYNIFFITEVENNYPLIEKEIVSQALFILICSIFLILNTKIYGTFSNQLFQNDWGSLSIKLASTIFGCVLLQIILPSYIYQKINYFEYIILFLLSQLAGYFMISSRDLISFYLSMEMQSLCFYILATIKKDSAFSVESGLKYFIFSSIMSAVYLFGASLVFGTFGTISLPYIKTLLSLASPIEYDTFFACLFAIGCILITCTLLFKLECAPFHFWSPDVYEGAPVTSTVIISTVPKIPVVYFFVRWLSVISPNMQNFMITEFVICCGVLSCVLGTLFSFAQTRLKRLIVYSSIAQVGFIVSTSAITSLEGYTYVCFFLLIYLLTSLLGWGHIVLLYGFQLKFEPYATTIYLSSFSNLYKYNPGLSFSLAVLFFSLSGIPPLLGFFPKLYTLIELSNQKFVLTCFFLVLFSTISMYYYIRIVKLIFFEPKVILEQKQIYPTHLNDSSISLAFIIIIMELFLLFSFLTPSDLLVLIEYVILNCYDL